MARDSVRALIAVVLAALVLRTAPVAAAEVVVTITDSTANDMLAAVFAAAVGTSEESPEGHDKGYLLNGMPVREDYWTARQTGSATVLVANRMTVEVRIVDLPAAEARAWLEKIDLVGLAALGPDAHTSLVHDAKLATFLPGAPEGWTAENPASFMSQAAGSRVSQAARAYRKK